VTISAYNPHLQLPHPTIPHRTLLLIEKALRLGWDLLRRDPPLGFDLLQADEDSVTQNFRLVMSNRVLHDELVKGFSRRLFRVLREPKYQNYKGDEIDKMPDLVVELIDRPRLAFLSDDGLFIECKPIDIEHTVGACYCGKGLIRFIDGRYAWAMPQAMMIGYIRGNYTIPEKLPPALKARSFRQDPNEIIDTLQYPISSKDSKIEVWAEEVYVSIHKRGFPYIQTQQAAPPITIRHLWLRRD
jgi:hypothetical protein